MMTRMPDIPNPEDIEREIAEHRARIIELGALLDLARARQRADRTRNRAGSHSDNNTLQGGGAC